jgi:hypothetical protein
MTTIAELVGIGPPPTAGVPAGFVHTAGEWRHVIEIADPGLGAGVVWHDVTTVDGLFTGYDYGRGADGYQGRFRASVVNLDFYANSDALAPWNPDNSATFGVHVELGPGLLIRSGFILVNGGVVTAWNPRFTCKVESWGDASYSQGRVRIHRVTARDTMSSLVNVPLPATTAENWSDRFLRLLADSGWPYGALMYGAQLTSAAAPILLLPDRPAASSAINELDAIMDPAGLVWYTNRLGQLIVRPRVEDTFHAAAFAAGATGTPWTDRPATYFAWWACQGGPPGEYAGADHAAYAVDTPSVDSFGFDDTDRWIINHVKIGDPTGPGFDDDDPVSIARYDRKSHQASWLAPNDTVAADMLTLRANATVEARPLHTNIRLDGFHPGPAAIEYLDNVSIVHRNTDEGLEVFGDGWLRGYTEQVRPLGCDTDWSMSLLVDVHTMSARNTELLPVEDLTLVDVTDTTATFTWTNPAQTITPTHTQIRMINPASLWATTTYPLDGLTWFGLTPETGYEFQVRLLRIVDGLTTHYSPIRSVSFVTEETADVPPVGPGCLLEWELQSSPDGTDPWTMVDSGVDDTAPFTLPDYDLDTLDPALWYRYISNEDCAGVDGPDFTTDPFVAGCLGADRLDAAPYDDPELIAYWPEVCPNNVFREVVSQQPMIRGHALARAEGLEGIPSPVLVSGTAGLVGYQILTSTPVGSHDLSIGCRIMIGDQPAAETVVFEYGGAMISIIPDTAAPDPDAAGYTINGTIKRAGDVFNTIAGTTIFGRGVDHDVILTHDPGTGDLILFVDGFMEVGATVAFGDRVREQMKIHLPGGSWITDMAAWGIILVPSGPFGPLGDAIMALGPLVYLPLLETSGSVANDYSGNNRHGAYASQTLANQAGLDGRLYPTFNAANAESGVVVPAENVWRLAQSGAGLTAFVLMRYTSSPDTAGNDEAQLIGSGDTLASREWRVYTFIEGANLEEVAAQSYTAAGTTARNARTPDTNLTNVWKSFIVRWPDANSYPTIYVNWALQTLTTGLTAAAGGAITSLRIGHAVAGGATGSNLDNRARVVGAFAHAAVFGRALTGPEIDTLKVAAQGDGWT